MLRTMKDMWSESLFERLLLVLIFAFFVVIPLALCAAIREQKAWDAFVETHDCKVVGRIKGDVGVVSGVMSNGKVGTGVTSTPDKTGYLCNDGVTYWR